MSGAGARTLIGDFIMVSCPRCSRSYDEGVRFCPVDGALVQAGVEDRNLGTVLLGQFEVRDVCGRGAMGTVYRAYQRNMDRIVAVKILRRELLKEPEVVRRFLREARASAKLQHPNIVTVHLVGETDDGVPFLVMEHVEGVALEQICEAQGPQPVTRLLSLAKQIANALAEAHDAGIIHRDLKPANILITDRSRVPDLVKVLDFGIAKIVHAADQSVLTRDGVIFGTPHYIAPEQATGGEIDHRVDLYSLGVILFRLATGRLPFEGTAGMQVVLKHLREQPPKPRTIDPTLPVGLEALILACLAKEPAQRPKDAPAVVEALERIASDPTRSAAATLLGVASEGMRPAQPVTPARVDQLAKPTPPAKSEADKPNVTAKVRVAQSQRPRANAVVNVGQPWWRSRALAIGGAAAVLLGGGLGVGIALWHDQANEPVAPPVIATVPAPESASAPTKPTVNPLPAEPALFDEKELSESGVSLRAGFEHAPQAAQPAPIVVMLKDAHGPLDNATVDVTVHPPRGNETVLALTGVQPGRYRSEFTFPTGGLYRVRVAARAREAKAPVVLAFDLELQPPPPVQARKAHRNNSKDDDLPVTVIQPEPSPPPAPITPRRMTAVPTKPASGGAPTVVLDPPAPPPSVEPARVVVEHPKPVHAQPAAEAPADDRPPPPAPDPTTVPMPSPDDSRNN